MLPAFITLLLIKLFIKFVPGDMVGSIDGWLGFLGGYAGGLISFLSAYFIIKNDNDKSTKAWVKAELVSPNEYNDHENNNVVFAEEKDVINCTLEDNQVVQWPDYKALVIKVSAISDTHIPMVNLRYGTSEKKLLAPYSSFGPPKKLFRHKYLFDIDTDNEFYFLVHIHPNIAPKTESNGTIFEVSTVSIYGTKNKQYYQLFFGKGNHCALSPLLGEI